MQMAAMKLTVLRAYRVARLRKIFEAAEHALDGFSVTVEAGEKQFFQHWLALGGMLGILPLSSTCRRMALLS